MFNEGLSNKGFAIIGIVAIVAIFSTVGLWTLFVPNENNSQNVTLEYDYNTEFGGQCPMKVYQIWDRDTGVYYAVTEKGGICIMETASGKTKLVDEGEPPTIHKNQESNNAQNNE